VTGIKSIFVEQSKGRRSKFATEDCSWKVFSVHIGAAEYCSLAPCRIV